MKDGSVNAPAAPQADNSGMVRTLVFAIGVMTLAVAFMVGAIFGRLSAPAGAPAPVAGVDFAAAPQVEIGLPPGALVVDQSVSAERLTLTLQSARGETFVYTTPLSGYDGPVRLVWRTLE